MAAFPSVFHGWIFLVLEARQFPVGFIDFIKSLYAFNFAIFRQGGVERFLFWIWSGVLQGCPASSFLFDVILDPFLEAFHSVIGHGTRGAASPVNFGIMRAAADDLGAALASLKGLRVLEPIFQSAEELAGLALGHDKCVIIPLSSPLDTHLQKLIVDWIYKNIPKWATFRIASAGKYLGFMVGPASNASQWDDPCEKYKLRASGIGSTHAPISISAYLYNTQAVSVLQYVAQFRELPKHMMEAERVALHRILHFATNALTRNGFLNLHRLGGPSLRSVQCTCRAALFNSSVRFKSTWEAWMAQLQKALLDHGTLMEIHECLLSPSFWDSLPMAASLEAAFTGWPKEDGFCGPIQTTMEEITEVLGTQVSSFALTSSPRKAPVQAIAYRNLFESLHPDDNLKILSRRLHSTLGIFCVEGWLDDVTPTLRKLKCYEVVQVLRTWSNSWSTSYRYHESRKLPCLLGCPGMPDCIAHYSSCPLIHEYVSATFGQYLFPDCLNCFGTSARNPDALRQVACIYYAYHVVKFHPGICTTHIRERTTHHCPDLEGGATQITASAIVVDVALARSSFIGGLKAAASSAGLNCPIQRSLPSAVGS